MFCKFVTLIFNFRFLTKIFFERLSSSNWPQAPTQLSWSCSLSFVANRGAADFSTSLSSRGEASIERTTVPQAVFVLSFLVNWSYWNKNNSFTKRWQPGAGQAPRWVRQDRGLAATGLNSVCCSRGKPRKLWTHAAAVLFFTRKPTVHCFPYYCARNSPHASRLTLNCAISQIDYVMITENPKSHILILWDKRVLVPHCTICCLYSTIALYLK